MIQKVDLQKVDLQAVGNRLQDFKNNGKKIIGIFPHALVPDELIYAANAIPVKLNLGGDEYATSKGTEYLTQATCPFARGCIGFFDQSNSIYKLLDGLIGGNYCNGDLCASEIITQFFKIPLLKVTFPTTTAPHSLKFLKQEFRALKKQLELFTGSAITQDNLLSACEKYNKLREAFQKLNQEMKNPTTLLKGEDLQNLIHHFFLLGPDESLDLFNHLQLERTESAQRRKPILLSGSGIALGDDLIHVIEEFNVQIVVNDTWTGNYFYNEKLDMNSTEDPIDNLAQYYLLKCECARMVPSIRRIPRVLKLVNEFKVKGVVNHILKFCDPYIADRRRFKQALTDAGIPVTDLERDYSTSLEQVKTRIGAFLEMIS